MGKAKPQKPRRMSKQERLDNAAYDEEDTEFTFPGDRKQKGRKQGSKNKKPKVDTKEKKKAYFKQNSKKRTDS